jgi:esterase/lipase superfamily enzyme
LLMAVVFLLCGCHEPLMPTPIALTHDHIDTYDGLPPEKKTTEVEVFYFTNRNGKGPLEKRSYGNGIEEVLHLGVSRVQIGGNSMTWEKLHEISNSAERKSSVPLILKNSREFGLLSTTVPDDYEADVPIGDQAFSQAMNQKLAETEYKEINIYVHGFLVDFYNANVITAQLYHFVGREGVSIGFSWSSRQRLLLYLGDIKRAKRSVDALVLLVEHLALHTDVERINLLSYSAGSPIVSSALVKLRQKYAHLNDEQLFEVLKVDDVVFAASDIAFSTFLDELEIYRDLPREILVTISSADDALQLSGRVHGETRIGAITAKDVTEEDIERIDRIAGKVNALDITATKKYTKVERLGGHQYWFHNSWISTDILMEIYLGLPPEQRGLEKTEGTKRSWYFPEDYPDRIARILLEERAKRQQERIR